MLKILLWGSVKVYSENVNLIKYFELIQAIEIVGIIFNNTNIYSKIHNRDILKKERICRDDIDLVIGMGDKTDFYGIQKEAEERGFSKNRVIPIKILSYPELDINKYFQFINKIPTIFSNNCWGGVVYHHLGTEFKSPFINMFLKDKDYIKFLENPLKYIECELEFECEQFNPDLGISYPVCKLNDIELFFNHYSSFDKAKFSWDKRKKRIDYNNIFVMMYTKDKEIASSFAKLPYKNKICFVPFTTKEKNLCYVELIERKELSQVHLYEIVNGMAKGEYAYYDILELVLGNGIKVISEILK